MARHVWKKESTALSICKYCEAEKRKVVAGKNGGKKIEYAEKGSKKTQSSLPDCIDKKAARKAAKAAKPAGRPGRKPGRKPGRVVGTIKRTALASVISGVEVNAVPPMLYNEHLAARQLGWRNTEDFLAAVEVGDIAKPLNGNRWTKEDLGAYVGLLKTRRVDAENEEREALHRAAIEERAALAAEAKVKSDTPEPAPAA